MMLARIGILSFLLFQASFLFAQSAPLPLLPSSVNPSAPASLAKSMNSTQAAAPANGTLTADHPVYTLQLNSNPTTGFSWFVVSYPSSLLTLTKHQFIPPQISMPGAGGYEEWQFTAKPEVFVAPRVLKIQMMYARSWEINDQTPIQSFYLVAR